MKYLLKMCAIFVLVAGYIDNCNGSEAANELAKTYSQKLKCVLQAKVKINFNGTVEDFSLFDPSDNKPQTKSIDFSVDGLENTKMKVEFDKGTYEMDENGIMSLKKLENGKTVEKEKTVSFSLKVLDSKNSELLFANESESYIAVLSNVPGNADPTLNQFKLQIKAQPVKEGTTILDKYAEGVLKFSFVPNE